MAMRAFPSVPRQRLYARATLNRHVVRSRAVDFPDEMWEKMTEEPTEDPQLIFPTTIYPAEQVIASPAAILHRSCLTGSRVSFGRPLRCAPINITRSTLRQRFTAFVISLSFDLQVLEALVNSVHEDSVNYFKSFYSSVIGGITTHPMFMTVPMDDHMVHRGHAVFDTAIVAGGHIYQLDQHVDRFVRSAELARIPLPTHKAQIKRIIMDTAAASCCQSGAL